MNSISVLFHLKKSTRNMFDAMEKGSTRRIALDSRNLFTHVETLSGVGPNFLIKPSLSIRVFW